MADPEDPNTKKQERVKKDLLSLLVSAAKDGRSPTDLLKDYRELNGCQVPFAAFGLSCEMDVLRVIEEEGNISIRRGHYGPVIFARSVQGTEHIQKLVVGQKKGRVGRMGGAQHQSRRGRGRARPVMGMRGAIRPSYHVNTAGHHIAARSRGVGLQRYRASGRVAHVSRSYTTPSLNYDYYNPLQKGFRQNEMVPQKNIGQPMTGPQRGIRQREVHPQWNPQPQSMRELQITVPNTGLNQQQGMSSANHNGRMATLVPERGAHEYMLPPRFQKMQNAQPSRSYNAECGEHVYSAPKSTTCAQSANVAYNNRHVEIEQHMIPLHHKGPTSVVSQISKEPPLATPRRRLPGLFDSENLIQQNGQRIEPEKLSVSELMNNVRSLLKSAHPEGIEVNQMETALHDQFGVTVKPQIMYGKSWTELVNGLLRQICTLKHKNGLDYVILSDLEALNCGLHFSEPHIVVPPACVEKPAEKEMSKMLSKDTHIVPVVNSSIPQKRRPMGRGRGVLALKEEVSRMPGVDPNVTPPPGFETPTVSKKTSNIMDLKSKVIKLLKKHPEGILYSEFVQTYEQEFRMSLTFNDYGMQTLMDLLPKFSDILSVNPITKRITIRSKSNLKEVSVPEVSSPLPMYDDLLKRLKEELAKTSEGRVLVSQAHHALNVTAQQAKQTLQQILHDSKSGIKLKFCDNAHYLSLESIDLLSALYSNLSQFRHRIKVEDLLASWKSAGKEMNINLVKADPKGRFCVAKDVVDDDHYVQLQMLPPPLSKCHISEVLYEVPLLLTQEVDLKLENAQQYYAEVEVSHYRSPRNFHLHLVEKLPLLMQLEHDMAAVYRRSDMLDSYMVFNKDLHPGYACAALTREGWRRVVIRVIDEDEATVELIDYGSIEKVLLANMRFLTEYFAKFPAQGLKSMVELIQPESTDCWPETSLKRFQELCQSSNGALWALFLETKDDNSAVVFLTSIVGGEQMDVTEIMVAENLARPEDEAEVMENDFDEGEIDAGEGYLEEGEIETDLEEGEIETDEEDLEGCRLERELDALNLEDDCSGEHTACQHDVTGSSSTSEATGQEQEITEELEVL